MRNTIAIGSGIFLSFVLLWLFGENILEHATTYKGVIFNDLVLWPLISFLSGAVTGLLIKSKVMVGSGIAVLPLSLMLLLPAPFTLRLIGLFLLSEASSVLAGTIIFKLRQRKKK